MLRFRPHAVPFVQLILAALLSACGGGGGGDSGGATPGAPAASPALIFAPATVNATIAAGTSLTVSVGATVVRPADFNGAGTVYATVTDSTGVIQPSAQLIRDSDTQYRAVLQTAATLAAGSYSGNFNVRLCRDSACASQFPGSPMQLPYVFQVLPAGQATFTAVSALPLTATAHQGGAAPAGGSVAITAPGRSWTASNGGAAWLKLGSTGGSGNATLAVGYDATGLALGTYTTTLTVTANDNQSASLPVTLTVLPSGLAVGSNGVTFTAINGAPVASQVISIDTDSKQASTWVASSDAAWLSATPTSGTTPATTVLTADPSIGPLKTGRHNATITLRSPGLPVSTLPVTLDLVQATMLVANDTLTLGGTYGRDFATPQSLAFTLNTQTKSWPWSMSVLPAWVTASVASGNVSQAGASTAFTAVPNNAPVGTTSAQILVGAQVNGDPVLDATTLIINKDRHKLIPAQTGVALSGSPGWSRLTRTIAVSDNFGNFGGMNAATDQPWLVAGVTGANLLLTADPSQLAPDSLNIATVTITPVDTDATAPETIRVALWKGTLSPVANVILPASYSTVITDPIRPYAYAHNGGAYIDVYNLYSGERVATMGGFSTSLGDMAATANGDYLLLHDLGHNRITSIDLATQTVSRHTVLAVAGNKATRLKVIRPNGVEMLVLSDGTAYATADWRRLPNLPLGGGTLAASGDGKRLLQQDEGNPVVQQTTVSVDYSALGGGMLFAARVPVASHAGVGTLGQDIVVSTDGTTIYSASGTPDRCSVISPEDLGVRYYLPIGGAVPNNVEIDVDGRVYCGGAARPTGNDVWIYNAGGTLVAQKKLASGIRTLLPRQMAVSSDGRLLIGITDDGATTIVPVGP